VEDLSPPDDVDDSKGEDNVDIDTPVSYNSQPFDHLLNERNEEPILLVEEEEQVISPGPEIENHQTHFSAALNTNGEEETEEKSISSSEEGVQRTPGGEPLKENEGLDKEDPEKTQSVSEQSEEERQEKINPEEIEQTEAVAKEESKEQKEEEQKVEKHGEEEKENQNMEQEKKEGKEKEDQGDRQKEQASLLDNPKELPKELPKEAEGPEISTLPEKEERAPKEKPPVPLKPKDIPLPKKYIPKQRTIEELNELEMKIIGPKKVSL